MLTAVSAHAVDQDVQVDILMSKIINAQKEGRAADALPSMAKLESMETTLKAPLPESFHFLYITALDESDDHANALRRANIYMEKFGKKGKNYAKVVDIIGRLEEEADKDAKAEAEKEIADAKANKEEEVAKCNRLYEDAFDAIKRRNWAMRDNGRHVTDEDYKSVQNEAREAKSLCYDCDASEELKAKLRAAYDDTPEYVQPQYQQQYQQPYQTPQIYAPQQQPMWLPGVQ
jgi:flagellin-specific chaperone FliS